MQAPLEIRYAGVIIGRAPELRDAEGDSTFFLPGKDPMPVGTVVRLRSGERETPARVLRALESADPSIAGMKVRLIGEAEEVSPDWIPTPAPVQAKAVAKPGTPTPTVEVDLALMQAESAKTPPVAAPESAAIPEAVPVAVGSSLTGALAKATESVTEPAAAAAPATDPAASDELDIIITDTPPPVTVAAAAPAAAVVEVTQEAPAEAASDATNGAPAEASEETSNENGKSAAADKAPAAKDMPVARPIAGPSGRRKTKRRRHRRT
jgi:hypothetical protein